MGKYAPYARTTTALWRRLPIANENNEIGAITSWRQTSTAPHHRLASWSSSPTIYSLNLLNYLLTHI